MAVVVVKICFRDFLRIICQRFSLAAPVYGIPIENGGLLSAYVEVEFLLVDLRCHGDSASIKKNGPNTVASAALDVLKLVAQLRVTPRVLVGHSFGGKVALSMVEQAAKPLAQPVRVWVLDATPGKVRAGGDGEDHPGELIAFLSRLPNQVSSKQEIVDALVREGFSLDVARVILNAKSSSHLNFSLLN
uniref:AB hydrolase-1 domain-containing protein n=1 Tax=Ananas comosus var. bracteatus TaxID=296719 RepID=A0A6V7PMY8_ANACO|nr:unnamed protein product [Ananas comosus var. bracteatus]